MELDKYNFMRLVEACECFYIIDDALRQINDEGLGGGRTYKIANILSVVRELSVYANQREDDMDDDIQYLKFKALIEADNYSIDEKVDILLGEAEDPLGDMEIVRHSEEYYQAEEIFCKRFKEKKE